MQRGALFVTLCLVGAALAQQQRYDGEQVLSCVPQTPGQLKSLRTIWKYASHVDWWSEPRAVGLPVHIHITQGRMTSLLNMVGLPCTVMIHDLQTVVEQERAQIEARRKERQGQDFDYENYHQIEEIDEWMDGIAQQYNGLVDKFKIGTSFEGRDMYALKITEPSGSKKPAVYIEGGIHACEWIGPATVIYMTKMLLESANETGSLLKELDWYVLPVTNPDGYKYAWTTSRTWRKTRKINPGSSCVGVDPNRNWPFHWGEDGAGSDPCADNYRGPHALSEREVANVTQFLTSGIDFRGFIDFHSFAQYWMYPWGYTKSACPDGKELNALSKLCVDALEKVHGTKYTYGDIADIIYVASGSSADWAYAGAKIKYSYGVELRDTGKHGFLLPADQIKPSGEETFAALQQWANHIAQQK